MRIYKFICDTDTFDSLKLDPTIPYKELHKFDGKHLAETWTPIKVSLYKMDFTGNFFRLTEHIPVFDMRAKKVTEAIISNYVEFLPLSHEENELGEIFAVNVLSILDCIDFNRASVKYFDDGSIMSVKEYAFREEAIGDIPIFRIKGLELKNVFVSDRFRDLVEKANLKGLLFDGIGEK